MLKLNISPKAEIDLEEIYDYTFLKWGVGQANKYQDELFDSMTTITQNPKIGNIYMFKSGNYRVLNRNKHLLFYTTTKKNVEIVRVLHERMNLKTRF